ncbi:hypothetical protein DFQ28_001672 [Apophysomyces sp. BC1034]|nr:hypothetical protein DFQ30_002085 [Apophysomyces sp. BC1015]KAG0179562.1 hypothetical protein DFQ29_001942 [Apophysomyces sp. BC1021]KAG0190704.1 hypothetical protein DFQ28_001672 [Apophysomyces sp. BC1034]
MKNSPKSVLLGWASLAGCTIVGYLVSKRYTDNRIQDYTKGAGSITSSQRYHAETSKQTEELDANGNKILRRSVQRSL